jgi:ankyrin repeat protein
VSGRRLLSFSGGQYGSALQAACNRGSLDVINVLLENGADPNLQGESNTFQQAMSNLPCQEANMGRPSKQPATRARWVLSSSSLRTGPTLICRVSRTQYIIPTTLSDHCSGGKFGTALQAACFGGSLDVVRVLLKGGVDPNLQGKLNVCTHEQPVSQPLLQSVSMAQRFKRPATEACSILPSSFLKAGLTPIWRVSWIRPVRIAPCLNRVQVVSMGPPFKQRASGITWTASSSYSRRVLTPIFWVS